MPNFNSLPPEILQLIASHNVPDPVDDFTALRAYFSNNTVTLNLYRLDVDNFFLSSPLRIHYICFYRPDLPTSTDIRYIEDFGLNSTTFMRHARSVYIKIDLTHAEGMGPAIHHLREILRLLDRVTRVFVCLQLGSKEVARAMPAMVTGEVIRLQRKLGRRMTVTNMNVWVPPELLEQLKAEDERTGSKGGEC